MFPVLNPNDAEPTAAELDAIEAEWPLIAAELDLLDAEVAVLLAGHRASLLDWRRVRRAEQRIVAVSRELSATPAARKTRAARTAVAS
jgi:hypothetical protein